MKKGISLVALVITIIVLIILTGTVILNVSNNNIIARAQEAVNVNDIALAEEKVLLELQNIRIKAELQKKSIVDYMNDNNVDLEVKDIRYVFNQDTISFLVDDKINVVSDLNGNIKGVSEKGRLGEAVNAGRYGNRINYNVSLAPTSGSQATGHLGNGWKIFYEDSEYIYIIVEDYLHNSLCPEEVRYEAISSTHPYYFELKRAITNEMPVNKAKQFGQQAWLAKQSSQNFLNEEIVLSMFSDAWTTKFGGGIVGLTCTAIACPTLEMWIKSWNAKEGTTLYGNSYTLTGYYVSTTVDGTTLFVDGLSTANKLYFPHDEIFSNEQGYWLASCSAASIGSIMTIEGIGQVNSAGRISGSYAYRPIVSILKSAVNITETSENSGIWNVSKK